MTREILFGLWLALIPTAVLCVGLSDRGFIKGAIRTEYEEGKGTSNAPLRLRFGASGNEGCLWNAEDPLNYWGCAGRAPFPGSIAQPWLGLLQNRDACGEPTSPRAGETWVACISYAQSKLFALNWQPGEDYWVAIANSDPSFDRCNLGPPNMSWPITNPAIDGGPSYFKIASEPSGARRRARLTINANEFTHRCRNSATGDWFYTIPFLSIGAQQGRGQTEPILYFARRQVGDGQSDKVSFEVAVLGYEGFGCRTGSSAICRAGGVHAGLWMTSGWGGKKRAVFVEYLGEDALEYLGGPLSRRWSWPIEDSLFFPGFDFAYLNSQTLLSQCGINFPRLRATPSILLTRYEISPSAVFSCASRLGLFETPMPDTTLALNGIHWYIESVGTSGKIELALENMTADPGAAPPPNVCKV